LRDLLATIAGNAYCVECDLVDPITIFIATVCAGLSWWHFGGSISTLPLARSP
jgi:hypothetical protein